MWVQSDEDWAYTVKEYKERKDNTVLVKGLATKAGVVPALGFMLDANGNPKLLMKLQRAGKTWAAEIPEAMVKRNPCVFLVSEDNVFECVSDRLMGLKRGAEVSFERKRR